MLHYLDRASRHLAAGFSPRKEYEAFREIINLASEAAAKGRRVEIRYRAASTGRTTTRKIDPYQVWAFNGVFYLIGLCHVRGAVRTFNGDRIKNISRSLKNPSSILRISPSGTISRARSGS